MRFCSEGDNTGEATDLALYLNRWKKLFPVAAGKIPPLEYPVSWKHLFGNPVPSSIYWIILEVLSCQFHLIRFSGNTKLAAAGLTFTIAADDAFLMLNILEVGSLSCYRFWRKLRCAKKLVCILVSRNSKAMEIPPVLCVYMTRISWDIAFPLAYTPVMYLDNAKTSCSSYHISTEPFTHRSDYEFSIQLALSAFT